MGVHRDGAAYGLSPFQAEMRRRLWWQMISLEFTAAELCGSELAPTVTLGDVRLPLFINDADIGPGAAALPPERSGEASEMMYPAVRNSFLQHFRDNVAIYAKDPGFSWHTAPTEGYSAQVEQTLDHLDALRTRVRALVEERYLRHADPAVPAYLLCRTRIAINFLAFGARARANLFAAPSTALPREHRDELFARMRRVVAADNAAHADPRLRRFRWHMRADTKWHTVLILLTELRARVGEENAPGGAPPATPWAEIAEAWTALGAMFANHPHIADRRDPLHSVILGLALKAWEALEREYPGGRGPAGEVLAMPAAIATLRQRRQSKSAEPGGVPASEGSSRSARASPAAGLDGLVPMDDLGLPGDGFDGPLFPDPLDLGNGGGGGEGGVPAAWNGWDEFVQNYQAHGMGGDAVSMAAPSTVFDAPMVGQEEPRPSAGTGWFGAS